MASKRLLSMIKRRSWKLLEEFEGEDTSDCWIVVQTNPGDTQNWDKMDNFRINAGFMCWATHKDDETIVKFTH